MELTKGAAVSYFWIWGVSAWFESCRRPPREVGGGVGLVEGVHLHELLPFQDEFEPGKTLFLKSF